MSDEYRPNSIEARIAVLESQFRAATSRLGEVSARTHALSQSMQVVVLNTDEARDQRAEMLEKINIVADKVNDLSIKAATAAIEVGYHVRLCDKRSARVEKIGLALLAALLPLIGFLVYHYLRNPT